MLYAFAILAAPLPQHQPIGIKAPAIAYIQVGELVVAIEPNLDVEALQAASEELLMQAAIAHDRVICELFTHETLLPLRFGTVFSSQQALADYLTSQQQFFAERLRLLSGYSEYLLKGQVTPPPVAVQNNLKGKDYLLAKRSYYLQQQGWRSQQQQEYQDLIALLQAASAAGTEDAWRSPQIATAQESETLKIYLLLTRDRAESLRQSLQTWQVDRDCWHLDLSLALPPYHFANLTA